MEYPDTEADPWGTPDVSSPPEHLNKSNGSHARDSLDSNSHAPLSHSGSTAYEAPAYEAPTYEAPTYEAPAPASPPSHDHTGSSSFTMPSQPSTASPPRQNTNPTPGWSYFDGRQGGSGGFGESPLQQPTPQLASPFGSPPVYNNPQPTAQHARGQSLATSHTAGSRATGRANHSGEEHVVVSLMPEKEGIFLFQHHNYEVTSPRRNSKVIRRYSDFVWLLDCLHKRYPFRILPLLPPKRVAVNGNHLSNDGAFIEKRRRGLGRFLNAVVRHPILSQEQLVVMFLTVPTELSVWRKQATISVQDEFAGRALPPGLQESLPNELEELFERTRFAVKRSAELYITVCNTVDRLVKRSEGVAADHGRLALSLASLVEATSETYATDTSDVAQINAGITSTGQHIRTAQNLMEDESRAWEVGVLEDLKRQRDTLVSVRDLFDRRDRLDRDNIPTLERRIESNEAKLQALRAKPEGAVKPGEVEKVVEAIIKDKESIVQQHNRSVFVRECIRDELLHFQLSQYHITRWNREWAQERVKYTEMQADNWRRLLDDLERMPLGG
jgi:sorting nexin-8